jgi:hypothetical protein
VFCVRGQGREDSYKRVRKWELISLEFRSSKGTAAWPEEGLEDLAYDVTFAVVHR